jgi:hypothetical protein
MGRPLWRGAGCHRGPVAMPATKDQHRPSIRRMYRLEGTNRSPAHRRLSFRCIGAPGASRPPRRRRHHDPRRRRGRRAGDRRISAPAPRRGRLRRRGLTTGRSTVDNRVDSGETVEGADGGGRGAALPQAARSPTSSRGCWPTPTPQSEDAGLPLKRQRPALPGPASALRTGVRRTARCGRRDRGADPRPGAPRTRLVSSVVTAHQPRGGRGCPRGARDGASPGRRPRGRRGHRPQRARSGGGRRRCRHAGSCHPPHHRP